MSIRSVLLASLLNSASNVDRKGLRDIGLLAELERCWLPGEFRKVGEGRAGDGRAGEAARLRKGLLEEKLMPGDGWRAVIRGQLAIGARSPVSSQRQRTVKQATVGHTWH
jgi:hypothetical protein